MSDYDAGGILPPPRPVNWNVLYWVVLGSEEDGAPRFGTVPDAERFVEVYGGDIYPVVDVKVIE